MAECLYRARGYDLEILHQSPYNTDEAFVQELMAIGTHIEGELR